MLASNPTPVQVFGPVRSCRLVLDKESGKLKGTAFVDYYKRASAEAAAESCAKARWGAAEQVGVSCLQMHGDAFAAFAAKTHHLCLWCTWVCRRKEGAGVVIGGREAQVDLALGQDDARALSIAKAQERGHGRDNRRLGLAKEGHIVEGSPAWEDMSAGDQAKRKRAAGVRPAACALPP